MEHIPELTSEHTTPLSYWKMVNCTLNKNEYRSTLQSSYHTLIFIAILTNNWYTIFYKRNHHHRQYSNDTKQSLQTGRLEVAQEGPINLASVLTLTMTRYTLSSKKIMSSNKPSPLVQAWVQLLETIPTAWVQLLKIIPIILITRITTLVHKNPI